MARCESLTKLPQEMGKLINLRHFIISCDEFPRLAYMPKGIEGLTCLRTLENFVLSSSKHGGKACSSESLKNLTNLRCLGISGSRNLGLLEALKLPPNLVKLCFEYYNETKWPNSIVSSTHLRELRLIDCYKCEYLPPLGKLSSLETLVIEEAKSVRKVGNEFLGIESDGTATSCIVFPQLKNLEFKNMDGWEEWDDITLRGDDPLVITIMSSLHYLNITLTDKLKKLPNYILQSPTLKQLKIQYCSTLSRRYKKGRGEDWHKISHIPDVTFYP